MVPYLAAAGAALVASGLTFFTGFGLGTLLLPVFALFFPLPVAVALTAVVHLLNNLFKLVLVGRRIDLSVALRFGLPALVAAWVGARLLVWLAALPPLYRYPLAGRELAITPVKLVVAALMVVFAWLELSPRWKSLAIDPKLLPLGGVLSGFCGGVSGHQGAFRSVFLLRAGLDKRAFIATGVAIAVAVDLSRLVVYTPRLLIAEAEANLALLLVATGAAFLGAFAGSRLLTRVTLRAIEIAVAVLLILVAAALLVGLA